MYLFLYASLFYFKDKKADLIINSYVDGVMQKVMKKLDLEIPAYTADIDPTKNQLPDSIIEWNIYKEDVKVMKEKYENLMRNYKKRKAEEKLLMSKLKKPKNKKWIKDEKVKQEFILKLENDIVKTDIIDVTEIKEQDDVFIE